jgi:hypothetical protein
MIPMSMMEKRKTVQMKMIKYYSKKQTLILSHSKLTLKKGIPRKSNKLKT